MFFISKKFYIICDNSLNTYICLPRWLTRKLNELNTIIYQFDIDKSIVVGGKNSRLAFANLQTNIRRSNSWTGWLNNRWWQRFSWTSTIGRLITHYKKYKLKTIVFGYILLSIIFSYLQNRS